jgi:hypothetical protein
MLSHPIQFDYVYLHKARCRSLVSHLKSRLARETGRICFHIFLRVITLCGFSPLLYSDCLIFDRKK